MTKRKICLFAAALGCAGIARAGTLNFTPTSGTVDYAINTDGTGFGSYAPAGFYVSSSGISDGRSASSQNSGIFFSVGAVSSTYSDGGIVLFFDGSLKLKDLSSVSIVTLPGSAPVSVNLWLDTNTSDDATNGPFFAFNSNDELTGLNGDDYYGGPAGTNIDGTTSFSALTGGEPGGSYTLAQFQDGDVAGINGDTPVALWIGLTSTGGTYNQAEIDSVTVTTPAAVPLPASAWSGLALLGGLGLLGAVKRHRKQMA